MKTIAILDIDLDFFLNMKYTAFGGVEKRRLNKTYLPWKGSQVVDFLENNCGLSRLNRSPGKIFIHHDEVFYFLRTLQETHNFTLKFVIDHVDAHADLGMGDGCYKYIATDILSRNLVDRSYPDRVNGSDGLSEGNFLSFALACRWIAQLNYINRPDWIKDLPPFIFKNFDINSTHLQLRQYTPEAMNKIINTGDFLGMAKRTTPVSVEPDVPFNIISYSDFRSAGKYDFIFLTQSPNYTPPSSDKLIPIIEAYIDLV